MVDIVWERVYKLLEDFNTRRGSCGESFWNVGFVYSILYKLNTEYIFKKYYIWNTMLFGAVQI